VKRSLFCVLWGALGCGATTRAPATPRPLGEDLLALVPAGAEVVLDVDVEQLRVWDPARRLFLLLPDAARARLVKLGGDPLKDVDAVVVGIAQAGASDSAATTLIRGDLDLGAARGALGLDEEQEYHGKRLFESAGESGGALAQLGPRLYSFGSRVDVRRAVDLALGDGESLRTARTDQAAREALARAPTAKVGRPALVAAFVGTDPLKARITAAGLPAEDFRWLALSLAVGDGLDVGAVASLPGPAEAGDLIQRARRELALLAGRPLVRLTGLTWLIDPVVLVAREGEVHLAYRLAEERVDRLIARLESLSATARAQVPPKAQVPK
jgi:hypothetical protein